MSRKEFFEWLDTQNEEYTRYNHSDYFMIYFYDYRGFEHVVIRVYQDGDIWRCTSDYKAHGDRPTSNYSLTSREPFAFEEEVLDWLKNQLEIFFSLS